MGPGKETPQIRRQCLGKILEFDTCVIVDTHTHTHVSVYVCLSTVHWSRTPEGIKSSGVQVPHIKWDSTCIWFRSKGKLDSLSQEWRGTRLYSREHAFPARLWARLLYRVSWWGRVGILARQALLWALDPVPGAASLPSWIALSRVVSARARPAEVWVQPFCLRNSLLNCQV